VEREPIIGVWEQSPKRGPGAGGQGGLLRGFPLTLKAFRLFSRTVRPYLVPPVVSRPGFEQKNVGDQVGELLETGRRPDPVLSKFNQSIKMVYFALQHNCWIITHAKYEKELLVSEIEITTNEEHTQLLN